MVPTHRAARSLALGLITALALTTACAGKDGAAGPMGPQGPQGPAGPGTTKLVVSGTASSSGSVSIPLPAAVGTNPIQPPHMDCYESDNPSGGVWSAVASAYTGSNDPLCGAVFSNGVWHAVMIQMVPGWTAAFVVSY